MQKINIIVQNSFCLLIGPLEILLEKSRSMGLESSKIAHKDDGQASW